MYKKIIILALILLFTLFAFKPLNKLPIFDEVMAIESGLSLVRSGSLKVDRYNPPYYFDHTVLYIFLLGLIGNFLGLKPFLLRSLGLVSVLLTVLLMGQAFRLLKPNRNTSRQLYFALAIFLLSPLVIQGSLITDMDSTFLVPLALLFLILFLKDISSPNFKGFILQITVLILIFWLKETFFPVIVISAIIYLLLIKKRHYFLIRFLPILIITAILSFISWILFAKFVNINPLVFIERNFLGVLPNYFISHILTRLATFKTLVLWLTPALSFFLLLFILRDLNKLVNFGKIDEVDLFAIVILSAVFVYGVLVPVKSVIKYWVVIMPMAAIYLSCRFNQYVNIALKEKKLFFIITSLLALSYFLSLKDPIYFLSTGKNLFVSNFKEIFASYKFLEMFAFAFPAIILSIAFIVLRKQREIVLLIFAIFAVASMLSLDTWQFLADYSTTYFYGERGYLNTINYVKNNLPPDGIIYARKDVAFHSQRKSFMDKTGESTSLPGLVQSRMIDYAVISSYFPTDAEKFDLLDKKGKLIFQNGSFRVYQIRGIRKDESKRY